MKQSIKTILTFSVLSGMAMWSLLAQAIAPTNVVTFNSQVPPPDANLIYAMYSSVIHNPASLLVIGVLCIFAWLADDLPFVNSRYVAHYTVMAGASSYWLFAYPASVPLNFPHPSAVFASNGIICGLLAFGVHKQVVSRLLTMARINDGTAQLYQQDKQLFLSKVTTESHSTLNDDGTILSQGSSKTITPVIQPTPELPAQPK